MRSIARTRRLTCAAALAAVLVTASCGGDGSGKTVASTTTAVTTTTTGTPSTSPAADLSKLLLTAAETGAGWTELGTTTPPQFGLVLCGKASAADMATLRESTAAQNGVQQVFRSEQSSPGSGPLKLVELIFRSDRAPAGFDAFTRVVDACRGQSWTELNKPTHLEPMTAPDLGDRTAAFVVVSTEPATATTPELTTRGPVVVVLVGDMLVALHSVDTQETGSKPRLSDAQLNEIAARAVDKVQAQG